ncbi:MAG: ATP-binding protein, partial [Clostridia bacterium]|nr:ATP-binding protein [Clostridia bacterium]
NEEAFYEKYIEEDFEERYVPKMFERIFKQYLIRQNRQGNVFPPLEKVGKYYYVDAVHKKNGEFDVVSLDEKGYIFYEVKYKNRQMNQSMIDEEIEQVKNAGLPCYRFGFISKSGFDGVNNDELLLYTLDDLYL